MPKVLLEDFQGDYIVDRKGITMQESSVPGRSIYEIPGKLSAIGVVNGNKRIYSKNVWAKNLAEGSALMDSIKRASSFGLLEHPKDGVVDLRSPISHLTIEARMEGEEIHGKIRVINTPEGQKLLSLIEAGYNPMVSSRGYGSLISRPDGVDEVQDDFVCEGWDVVAKPSFAMAVLSPHREAPAEVKEAVVAPVKTTLQPVAETVTPSPAAQQPKPNTPKHMEIKSLRESIGSLKAVALSAVTPAKFAEGMRQMEALHEELEVAVKADGVSAYEVSRLHRDIEDVQTKWQSAVEAPAKQAQSVSEANLKTLRVLKVVTETAVKLHASAAATTKKLVEKDKLVVEVVKRGRDWKARCDIAETKLATASHKLEVATAALDKLRDKYVSEMTESGRIILSAKYADFLKENAELEAELKAAKHPAAIGRIRESIEAKLTAAETPSEEVKDEAKTEVVEGTKETEKTPVNETKDEVKSKTPAETTQPERTVQVLTSRYGLGTGSVAESISLSRRLSPNKAAVEAHGK